MEALSIQPVKANHRPAGTQARSALGDIFQTMLQDNLQQQETSFLPPRADARPEQDAPRHSRPDERVSGAAGDRPYGRDTDYNVHDAAGVVERRQAPSDTPVQDREAPKDDDATQAAGHPEMRDQSSDNRRTEEITPARESNTPAPDSTQGAEEQIASASGTSENSPNPATPNTAQASVAPLGGNSVQTGQTDSASGNAGGAPAAAAAINQAQNPASSKPAAPATGATATPTAPASTGTNGASVHVTITPGQVVATPNAKLGGGAATTAIATAGNPDATTPAAPNPETANRAAQNTPVPAQASQSAPKSGGQPGTSSNVPIAQADGQPPATQPASTAATPLQGENAAPANAQPRSGTAQGNLATDVAIHNGSTETSTARPVPVPGAATQDAPGQNDGAKIGNAQNQQAQGGPDQAPKTAPQDAATANPQMAAAQSTQARAAKASGQVGPGTRGGSTGPADAASSRASSAPTAAPSGFAQAAAGAPDTLGSLTRSGGTQSSTATQVAVEIQRAVTAGKDQIRIRLHPAELGQIDVSLKVRNDGTVKVNVTIERPETFDLMQRDSRALERALQDAGLKTDSSSLNFNLRGGDQHGPNDGPRGQSLAAQSNPEPDRKAEAPPPEADTPAPAASNRALDIHV